MCMHTFRYAQPPHSSMWEVQINLDISKRGTSYREVNPYKNIGRAGLEKVKEDADTTQESGMYKNPK